MDKLKIGIVGCGAIGSSLAGLILKELPQYAQLSALFDRDYNKSLSLAHSLKTKNILISRNLDSLISNSQLVIECASAAGAWDIIRRTISRNRDVLVMSVAGLAEHLKDAKKIASRKRARIYIPSGAVCGIDALKAAKEDKLRRVTLITRKSPDSFKGVKFIENKRIKLNAINKDRVLFYGSARNAIKLFPQNINVSAVLGIAGLGVDKTLVKIVASKRIKDNIHELLIESASGRVICITQNKKHPKNPKTSYLAVLSAMALIRQIVSPIRVGT